MTTFLNPEVARVFSEYPDDICEKLLFLRAMIFSVAAQTKGVGKLEETLRWGEPTYKLLNF